MSEKVNRETGEIAENIPARDRLPRLSLVEYAEKMNAKGLTVDGREIPDPVPVQPPVGYTRQPSMRDHIRDLVQRELSRRAEEEGLETFAEAEDFEVEGDIFPASRFEVGDDLPSVAELESALREARAREAQEAASQPRPQPSPGDGEGGQGDANASS